MNDVPDTLIYSNCLMFADDLKIFCRVKSILDATNLQRDLDTLSSWCQRNCLALNINKCKTMSFYRNRSPIYFNYEIQNKHLMRVLEIRDLGVVFNRTLSFNFLLYLLYCFKSVFNAWFYDKNMLRLYRRICFYFPLFYSC